MPSDPRPAIEDADVETSSEGYAGRFAGPVGAFFLDVQSKTTLELLARWPRASIVDVGGGHGQLTGPLVEAGFRITVLGSAPACCQRVRGFLDAGKAGFVTGNLLRMPFPDRSFDIALAFRLLPHLTRWDALVAELCRIARHAVVVDYPTKRSLNAFSDAFFGLKKSVEKNTRPFAVFADGEIERAFAANGLHPTARKPQFFFPMALHRALGTAPVSRALEATARGLGLTRAFGSPVILKAEP